MFNFVDILGTDENEKTVLASYRNGSFTLDVIPAVVNYMKGKDGYVMLLKDAWGLVIEVTPDSTLESVEQAWQDIKDANRNFLSGSQKVKEVTLSPMCFVAPEPVADSSQPTFSL